MRVLRLKSVEDKTGLKKTKLYEEVDAGRFPRPINLGERAMGWIESEIDAWLAARIAERDRAVAENIP